MKNTKTINYILLSETAAEICEFYGENIENLEEWQVCELVDRFIDEKLHG